MNWGRESVGEEGHFFRKASLGWSFTILQTPHCVCYIQTITENLFVKGELSLYVANMISYFKQIPGFPQSNEKIKMKKGPAGKHFEVFFSYILLKLHFEWKIWPKDMHNKCLFFQNQGTFFNVQKRTEENLLLFASQRMRKSLQCYFKCEDYFAMILHFHMDYFAFYLWWNVCRSALAPRNLPCPEKFLTACLMR